tara:strand:+ start:43 stop:1803 length:1761 start_codon:yes stop_codon:yes gene_type:complete
MPSSGNFPVLNTLYRGQRSSSSSYYSAATQGNTRFKSLGTSADVLQISTVENLKTGKWYWEFVLMSNNGDRMANTGVADSNRANWDYTVNSDVYGTGTSSKSVHFYTYGQIMRKNGSDTGAYSTNNSSHSIGDVFGFALDTDNGKAYAHKNGTYYASGNPATGANPGATWTVATEFTDGFTPYFANSGGFDGDGILNFGQDSTFGGAKSAGGNADENGFGDFQYAPPSGFLAVCSANLPISDDIDPAQTDTNFPAKQFNTINYTGNDGAQSVTGLGLSPDLIWLKARNSSQHYALFDTNRGALKRLGSSRTNAEDTDSSFLSSFDADGFSWSSGGDNTQNGSYNYVAWCWRANGGTTSSNGNGSITSTVQSSTSGGFSIITYTGNGSSGATIGHGLSSKPEWIIVKNRSSSEHWTLYHVSAGATDYTTFTASAFTANSGFWNDTEPTNSLITLGNNARVNSNGDNYVCYAWHGVDGYSKFSNYKGTGSSDDDGVFVYTGFRPKLLYLKKDGTTSWNVFYSPPKTFNSASNAYLTWDTSDQEANGVPVDFLSNGFKVRSSGTGVNASGTTFYYGCWGDVPWKYNNTF